MALRTKITTFFIALSFVGATHTDCEAEALSATVNRLALVQAGKNIFCPLVQYTVNSLQPDEKLNPHRQVLLEVLKLCQTHSIGLRLVPNFDGYTFYNANNNRFMGIHVQDPDDILVSEQVLNQPDFAPEPLKPLNFVLQTLMHEYTNIVSGVEQHVKDFVAREFAARYYVYETLSEEEEGVSTLSFSIPPTKIDQEFAVTQENQAQPSYLLLVNNRGTYQDLTPFIAQKVTNLSPGFRSIWTESNRWALMLMEQMNGELHKSMVLNGPAMKRQLREDLYRQARAQGIPISEVDKIDLDQFERFAQDFAGIMRQISSHEIKLFAIHRLSLSPDQNNEMSLLVQAVFALNRAHVDRLKALTDSMEGLKLTGTEGGIGIKKIIQVPLLFRIPLKRTAATREPVIEVDVRPDLSFEKVAKLGQISRSGPQIKTIKVKLELAKKPKNVSLRINHGLHYFLLPSSSIQTVTGHQYQFEFILPEDLAGHNQALFTDSVLIDQSTSYMMDRLLVLNEGEEHKKLKPVVEPDRTLITPGLLVRDFNNEVAVATSFHPLHPLVLMNLEWYNFMAQYGELEKMDSARWLNMDSVELRFGLKTNQRIKQVRLQISYDVIVGVPTEEDAPTAKTGPIQVDGETIKVWSSVDVKDQENYYQSILFDSESIHLRQSGDMAVVSARAKIPFVPISRPVDPQHGYGPPMVRPHKIEVVLDDPELTTITHTFPVLEMPGCEEVLKNFRFNAR